MSVDKFGRSHNQKLKKDRKSLLSPFTATFSLTASGDYDFLNRRLTNVSKPSGNNDAINKLYFDKNLNETKKEIENVFQKLENTFLHAFNDLTRRILILEEKKNKEIKNE
jgi:hypothetical protein